MPQGLQARFPGRCAFCKMSYEAGTRIYNPGRSGWGHLDCAVAHMEIEKAKRDIENTTVGTPSQKPSEYRVKGKQKGMK